MYYILYWVILVGLFIYKAWNGTLTDRRQAQVDDLKSFAQHVGERLDAEQGLGGWWPAASLAPSRVAVAAAVVVLGLVLVLVPLLMPPLRCRGCCAAAGAAGALRPPLGSAAAVPLGSDSCSSACASMPG